MLFFALCEDDPDVPAISVISSAKRLASAERTDLLVRALDGPGPKTARKSSISQYVL